MEERKGLILWIKEHRTELIIAGVSIGMVILLVLGIKKRESIKALWESLKMQLMHSKAKTPQSSTKVVADLSKTVSGEAASQTATILTLPFEVKQHIRNLPAGWHASQEKLTEAIEKNIVLREGQTLVDGYMKGVAVA